MSLLGEPACMNKNKIGIYGFDWLYTQVSDDTTKELIDKVIAIEKSFMVGKPLPVSNDLLKLYLGDNIIWTRENTTHSIPFGYYQIFRLLDAILPESFRVAMDGTIVDVGANEGHWSLYMARQHPTATILAIEPNPIALELLEKNISSNNISNVEILPIAISSKREVRKLEVVNNVTSLSSFQMDRSGRPWLTPDRVKEIDVQSDKLDNLQQLKTADTINLLKIDVEGAELEVLTGADEILEKTERIEIEYASNENRAELINFLKRQGFSLVLDYVYPDDYPNQRGDLFLVKSSLLRNANVNPI
jgi:FkbM family methyltransferase